MVSVRKQHKRTIHRDIHRKFTAKFTDKKFFRQLLTKYTQKSIIEALSV